MATQKKIFQVENLTAKVQEAKGLVLADYQGLKVDQINALRKEIKSLGAEFEVVKNSLLSRALKIEKLTGPTAALWLYKEDFSPLAKLASLKVKFGFWQKEKIDSERISFLANLPSIEQLQANLIGLLKSPTSRLVNNLNMNTQKLILILKAKSQ